jgi:hypothetical protein
VHDHDGMHVRPRSAALVAALAEGYGFRIVVCSPHDPAKKGVVEAGVKYVKRSFMPLREFRDLADANRRLRDWVMQPAGTRERTTREQPLARFAIERPLLAKLPNVAPVRPYGARSREKTRLLRLRC